MKNLITKSDVKYIQSLAHKKFREEEGVFVIEGVKMVGELIDEFPDSIVHLYATQNWVDENRQQELPSIPLSIIDEIILSKISKLKSPNQVLAVVKMPIQPSNEKTSSEIILVLDQIQDPGNLGTIIRTCDWFGIQSIICSLDTVDAYNSKTVQSAKGSLLRINIQYVDLKVYLSSKKGVPVYAAALEGTSIHKIDVQPPAILVIGNEANGISTDVMAFATQKVTIPKFGRAESLNAGIATAIILSNLIK
jgi:TrmH family RNA methyltransferase